MPAPKAPSVTQQTSSSESASEDPVQDWRDGSVGRSAHVHRHEGRIQTLGPTEEAQRGV